MHSFIYTSLSFIAMFIFSSAHAETLTLHQAVNLAGHESPEIQKATSSQNEAYWQKIEAYSSYLPTLNANADHLFDKKYVFTDIEFGGNPVSFPGIVPTTTYSLGAEWGLFDGFRSTQTAKAARLFEQASDKELDWTKFKIARAVTLQYFRALAAKTLQGVAESNLSLLKDHLKEVQLFKRSGLSTNYDVLRVEVQVSEAESELLNSQDNVELAKSKLSETLGVDGSVEPSGKLPELTPGLIDQLKADGPARADLQALSNRVTGLDYQGRASGRHWIPQLSVFGSYLYYNNLNDDYDDWSHFRNAYQVGLRLKWNLFDGFRSTARAHEAIEKKVQTEASLRSQQLKARQDVSFWTRKYKYYISIFKARQNDIGKTGESVRLAREGRKAGARTNTDLLDAEAELYRAKASAISAQLGAIEALINVELASGQPLYDFE